VRGFVIFPFKNYIALIQHYYSGYYPANIGIVKVDLLRYWTT